MASKGKFCLQNLKIKKAENLEELLEMLRQVYVRRKIRDTTQNKKSSRSHVFVKLKPSLKKSGKERSIKVTFVDLAGSERYSDSEIKNPALIKERNEINQSLSSLARVVNGVNQNYDINHLLRGSSLTKLLFSGLGTRQLIVMGNLKTDL